MAKLLLINHYAGSRLHGMEYRPYYLAREFVRLGHHTTITAASVSHVRAVSPTMKSAVKEEEIDGIRYVWLKTLAYKGNGVRRVINMLTFVARLLIHRSQLVGAFRPDVVIASSTYPLDIVPAAVISREHGARLVFEVHDLWPLSVIEVGGLSKWHPFVILLQLAEDFAYRRADRVVSLLPGAKTYMLEHGMAAHKFEHIPNGIDVAEWETNEVCVPREHEARIEKLRREGRFCVAYVGAHGFVNALDTILNAAQLMREEGVGFVLVGQGTERDALQAKARELGLTDVWFLPSIPKASVPGLLRSMDALFIGLRRSAIFRFGISPNKLMDYMMAGKPILQAIEAGNDMVAESGCGVTIPPENPEALVEAIRSLMSMTPSEREAMGRRGREYVMAHHDYRLLARRFLDVLEGDREQSTHLQ